MFSEGLHPGVGVVGARRSAFHFLYTAKLFPSGINRVTISISIYRAGVFLVLPEEQLHYVCVTALNDTLDVQVLMTGAGKPSVTVSLANIQTYRN